MPRRHSRADRPTRSSRRRGIERLESRLLFAVQPLGDGGGSVAEPGACPLCGTAGCRHTTDDFGRTFVECHFSPSETSLAGAEFAPVANRPLSETFQLHSRPTATKRIYLDFDGHVTTGTAWRGGGTIDTPAYSLDADFATFSDEEKAAIQEIWSRVAEDFAPFDVDVTTEEPVLEDLIKSDDTDSRWGMRVVVGGDGSWLGSAAGVAYLNSFSWDSDTPCFVFAGQWWKAELNGVANVISHEVGHTLGLSHDGHNGSEYYGGRGTGETSWGPLMGNPFFVNLTQWSRGDYGGATNPTQDDLAVIVGNNGFGYRPDDHGDSTTAATATQSGNFTVSGVISSSVDVDMFRFVTNGRIEATISPQEAGPNLDVLATIFNESGEIVAESNPIDLVGASFSLQVNPGTYFLAVRGTGMGDVNTVGYSNYGSLGQYTATVDLGAPVAPTLSIAATSADKAEGDSGTTAFTFTVTRDGSTEGTASVEWVVAGSGTNPVSAADFDGGVMPSGTMTFADGVFSQVVVVLVTGDVDLEADESFTITLSNAVGAGLGTATAAGVIRNDDEVPPVISIAATDAELPEGNSGSTPFTFTLTRSGSTAGSATVEWAVTGSGSMPATESDFVDGILPTGTVTFAPGVDSQVITINVLGDVANENDETFTVTLSNAVGATLGVAGADGMIRNDDEPPTAALLSIAAVNAARSEGNNGSTPFTFLITRRGGSTGTSSVSWSVSAWAGLVNGQDFEGGVFPAGTVSFAPGETRKTITVNVVGDTVFEGHERFLVRLSNPLGANLRRVLYRSSDPRAATLGNTVAVGTIVNDDAGSRLLANAGQFESHVFGPVRPQSVAASQPPSAFVIPSQPMGASHDDDRAVAFAKLAVDMAFEGPSQKTARPQFS